MINDTEFQDTIPETYEVEEQDADVIYNETVTPNDEVLIDEGVERDAKLPKTQNFASENAALNEPFITVQYNHKSRDFTKDEAIKLIQKGMHTESLRNKLEYLAKIQNTDVNSIVEKMVSQPENAHKAYLENLYGEGSKEVEIGMKIYREQQSDEYKKMMAESDENKEYEKNINGINSRLADEYLYLKQQIPDAPDYCNLPDDVIIEAASGKRDLFSSYLCHLHNEQTKINAAKEIGEAAKNASSGKMNDTMGDDMSSAERSFLLGLWSK